MATELDQPTEADYFRYDDESDAAMRALACTSQGVKRARLLTALGSHDWHRAQLHTAVFGPDLDEDGVPQAEWLADSAYLLWTLAEAEHYRGGRAEEFSVPEGFFGERRRELREAAAIPLFCWQIGARRRPLLAQLVEAWLPVTRGQAVEAIACIPGPRWMR